MSGEQGGAGLAGGAAGAGSAAPPCRTSRPTLGPGLGVRQQGGPAAVARDCLGRQEVTGRRAARRSARSPRRACPATKRGVGDVHRTRRHPVARSATASRTLPREGGRSPGSDDVHLAGPERAGRRHGAVEHQVRPGQRQGRVFGAGRLALAEVDHDDRARCRRRRPPSSLVANGNAAPPRPAARHRSTRSTQRGRASMRGRSPYCWRWAVSDGPRSMPASSAGPGVHVGSRRGRATGGACHVDRSCRDG